MSARKVKNTNLPAGVPYEPDLLDRLRDPEYGANYLTACLNSGGEPEEELEVFLAAIGKIVKALGVADVAHEMEMSRDALYKIFAGHQNPTTKTLLKLLDALQFELTIIPKQSPARRTTKKSV